MEGRCLCRSILRTRASFEFLKTLAKERLSTLRATNPAARLADAQLAVARDYGFPSWRALKKELDHRRAPHVAGFISACTAGDVDGLEAILEKDPVEAGADVHGAGEVHQSGVIGWAARERGGCRSPGGSRRAPPYVLGHGAWRSRAHGAAGRGGSRLSVGAALSVRMRTDASAPRGGR